MYVYTDHFSSALLFVFIYCWSRELLKQSVFIHMVLGGIVEVEVLLKVHF